MTFSWQGPGEPDTMTPMDETTYPIRNFNLDLADEQIRGYRSDTSMDHGQRAWNILSILGLMIFDITEEDLRDTLILGGMDLDDPEQYEISVDHVSLFVVSGTINVTEPQVPTIVDHQSDLALRYAWNDELQAKMDKIKFDGIFFREILVPNSEVGE